MRRINRLLNVVVGTLSLFAPAMGVGFGVAIERGALAAPSAADSAFIEQANTLAGPLSGTVDAAAELAPAIIAMKPSSAAIKTVLAATLITPESKNWGEVEAWATSAESKKVLEVLTKITDPKAKFMWALKYGAAATNPDWVKAGFFVDLGTPPTLAGAQFKYLEKLDEVSKLCTVEAARLVQAGDGKNALRVLTEWLRFARMMADREFLDEKAWGMLTMMRAAERFRDLLYQNEKAFTPEQLIEGVKQIAERELLVRRMRMPEGDRLAAEQLIVRTISERGGPNPDTFAATMARKSAGERSLNLFTEAAYWGQIEAAHAGWFDTKDELAKVWGDWKKRWEINDPNDTYMRAAADYSRMDKTKFALVETVVAHIEPLPRIRERLYLEISGTRMAMAVIGFKLTQDQLPPNIKAVEPKFIRDNELDFYNYNTAKRQTDVLRFWVPIRDQSWGERELPKPHEVTIVPPKDAWDAVSSVEGDVASEVAEQFFGLTSFPALGPEVFDPTAGTLDVAKLREMLKDRARREPIAPEEVTALNLLVKAMAQFGSAPGKMEEESRKVFQGYLRDSLIDRFGDKIAQTTGLTTDEMVAYYGAVLTHNISSKAWKDVTEKGRTTQNITENDVRALREALVESAVRDEFADNYLKKMLPKLVPGGGASGESFRKSLDDSQFLLYSLGPNRRDDRARVVGDGGQDFLYWPPLVSMMREHLNKK